MGAVGLGALLVLGALPAGALAVEVVAGNPRCADLLPGSSSLKVEPVVSGDYTDGSLHVDLQVVGASIACSSASPSTCSS